VLIESSDWATKYFCDPVLKIHQFRVSEVKSSLKKSEKISRNVKKKLDILAASRAAL
jgi:hypothetical protein